MGTKPKPNANVNTNVDTNANVNDNANNVVFTKFVSSRKDSFGRTFVKYENNEISASAMLHYISEQVPTFLVVVNAINNNAKIVREQYDKGLITKTQFQASYHPFTIDDFGASFDFAFDVISYVAGEIIGNNVAQSDGEYAQIVEHKLTDFGGAVLAKLESVQKRAEAHRNAILASL